MHADSRLGRSQADALAGQQNERLLQRTIAGGRTHAFESKLDAHHLPGMLAGAAPSGIAETAIRRRDRRSRLNLIELLPSLAALRLYDNSPEADPAKGVAPHPRLLLHLHREEVVGPDNLSATPDRRRRAENRLLNLSQLEPRL